MNYERLLMIFLLLYFLNLFTALFFTIKKKDIINNIFENNISAFKRAIVIIALLLMYPFVLIAMIFSCENWR